MDFIKIPKRLEIGDTVGIISPSAPLAGLIEHRYKNGIKGLEKLGFNVIVGKHALDVTSYTAGSAQARAEDIMNFFKDKKIKAIISFIGGYHSNQILKYLDFDIIRNNPKIIMGYSDMTVLLLAIYSKCGYPTFYGPSVLNHFADIFLPKYTLEYFKKAVMEKNPIGNVYPSELWTYEFLDWFQEEDIKRKRIFIKNFGWEWLKKGKAERKSYRRLSGDTVTFKGNRILARF